MNFIITINSHFETVCS